MNVQTNGVNGLARAATRYTLYRGLKRLDIENRFTKEPGETGSNETIFYAFPFTVPGGKFRLDIPGAVARYPEDFRPETDWTIMPAQSFVSVSNGNFNVLLATREGPNFEFGSMRKFFDHPSQPDLSTTTVFAQPLTKQTVNKDDYDFEGGTYEFHYALTSGPGPFGAAEALRFAWGFQRGFHPVALGPTGALLPPTRSFVVVEPAEVLVSALKLPDDGSGLIIRLWNPGETPAHALISIEGLGMAQASATDLLGRDSPAKFEIRGGKAVVPCGRREFVTVRLQLKKQG